MRDWIKYPDVPENGKLITSFGNTVANSYLSYKKEANLDRTLINCAFRAKEKTKAQETLEAVIQEEKDKRKEARLEKKRLREEAIAKANEHNFWFGKMKANSGNQKIISPDRKKEKSDGIISPGRSGARKKEKSGGLVIREDA